MAAADDGLGTMHVARQPCMVDTAAASTADTLLTCCWYGSSCCWACHHAACSKLLTHASMHMTMAPGSLKNFDATQPKAIAPRRRSQPGDDSQPCTQSKTAV